MNFIPFNRVDGLPWRRPAAERAAEMVRVLHRRGVLAKLRQSAAQEVDGGCGQLRARAAADGAAPGPAGRVARVRVVSRAPTPAPAPTVTPTVTPRHL
jgi:hypothetical protein